MGRGDALKVLKIAQAVGVQFENLQNMNDHKSQNARASSYDFLLIIYSIAVSTGTSALHSIIYTVFMHSSLTNQKCNMTACIYAHCLSINFN